MLKLNLKELSLAERVTILNEMMTEGYRLEAFEKFYAENVVQQENDYQPVCGKDACRKNAESLVINITEFRNAKIKNIVLSNNISVIEWELDFTHEVWGDKKYTQIAVQRWNNEGEIINENFFTTTK